jgi:O-antigen/teichoic acid export membrane protein
LSLVFGSLNVIRNYFTSIVKNEYVVKAEICRTIIAAVIKLLLIIGHFPVIWFIVANTFEFLLISSGYVYAYRKQVGPMRKWNFDRSTAKLLLRESFPLLLSGATIVIYQRIDQLMIRNMVDTKAVGQFAVASGIVDYCMFVFFIMAQTLTPLLVQSFQNNKGSVYSSKKVRFIDVMVWGSIPMALIISLSAHPIIFLLYGEKYFEAIPVLRIISWKIVFLALSLSSGQLIIIEHLQKYAVFRNIFGCVMSILLNLLLIPMWGIIGSAIAAVATVSFVGYFSHLFIAPYRSYFQLQTSAMFSGWRRIARALLA